MKRTISILGTLLVIAHTVFGQQITISGKILDKNDKSPIEFANVTLLKPDSTFIKGVNSDMDGQFRLETSAEKCLVAISYIGYNTRHIAIEKFDENTDLGIIPLEMSSIALKDIVITAHSIINKSDRKLILPSVSQVRASSGGIDLLKKLHLARVEISTINNNIKSSNNGEVQLRINGVLSSYDEIQSILPDDIIRIEYHDDPGLRYGNAEVVIDYIVKRRESGGNINGNLMNMIGNTGFAEDGISAKINHKKSEFGLNAYFRHRKLDWTRENYETYNYPNKIVRRTEKGEPTQFKYKNLNLALNYSFIEVDKQYLNITFRSRLNNVPNEFSNRRSTMTTYSNSDTISRYSVFDYTSKRSNSPSLDLYYQRNIKKDHLLIFNVVGTYIDSKVDRKYGEFNKDEQVTDIQSNIVGDKYSIIGEGIYEIKTDKTKITAGIKHEQAYIKNDYSGNVISQSNVNIAETYVYGEYQIQHGKFNYALGLGTSRSYYGQKENNMDEYILRPVLRVNYNINETAYIRYKGNVYGNTPSPANRDSIMQPIDSLQIRKGNPNLKMSKVYQNNLTAGFNKGIFDFELYSHYNISRALSTEQILFDDKENLFVRTYENQKKHRHLQAQLSIKIKPIKDYLSISLRPGINRYISEGENYKHSYTNKYIRLGINGNYKKWSFEYEFMTPQNYFYGEYLSKGEQMDLIAVKYTRTNYSLGVGAFNPFGSRYKIGEENWSKLTPIESRVFTNNFSQMFFIKGSFNINFGRQVSTENKRVNNVDNDAGIMSGSK